MFAAGRLQISAVCERLPQWPHRLPGTRTPSFKVSYNNSIHSIPLRNTIPPPQIPSPATSPCTSIFSNTFYFTQRLHPILQFLLSLAFLSSPIETFCLHLEGLVVGAQVTKTAGQWRSPVTVTRAEPSGGGCLLQEEGNEDIAEVGEMPLPSAPERKLVSFFRLLPPSPQVNADLSNRRCMVQRSRGKQNCRLSFPDNLKFIWTRRSLSRCRQTSPSGGRNQRNGIGNTQTGQGRARYTLIA